MKMELAQQIMVLRQQGVTHFSVVCDYGVGLYAAEIINALRNDDSELMLFCITPYEEQATKWTPALRERYFDMLIKCTHMTAATVGQIKAIMQKPAPYSDIFKLPALLDQYIRAYDEVLQTMEEPVLAAIEDAKSRVFSELEGKESKPQFMGKFAAKFQELHDKATSSNNVATLQNIKVEADALKVRCLNEISDAETKILARKAAEDAQRRAQADAAQAASGKRPETPTPQPAPEPPKPKIKKQKTVSIKSINTSNTWQLESADDVRRYVSELQDTPTCIFGSRPFCVQLRRRTPSPPESCKRGSGSPGGSARRIPCGNRTACVTHPARAYGERLLFSSCATVLSQPHFLRDVLHQRFVTQTAQLPQPNEKGGEGHAHCICHLLDPQLIRCSHNAVTEYGDTFGEAVHGNYVAYHEARH